MEERQDDKSRMIDHLGAQIRTLSNAILGFSELLDVEELDPTQREYLLEIRHAGQGLSGVVEEILEAAQRDADGEPAAPGQPGSAAAVEEMN